MILVIGIDDGEPVPHFSGRAPGRLLYNGVKLVGFGKGKWQIRNQDLGWFILFFQFLQAQV